MTHKKKLIEVALPLDAINKASAREKSIRHGHPSTLHLWWARRPLAAARAVIFAQMVDDPSAHPDLFPTEKKQEKERQRLFRIIEDLVLWENTTNEEVLQRAREEIWQSWRRACAENADHPRAKDLFDRNQLPAFHDPFAGGGALPLEAQRLGLVASASDLNPVAVLINKAMIEIPPLFAGQPPTNPDAQAKGGLLRGGWKGAQGLAEDVRYYGKWMRDEAEKRIGRLYPTIAVTAEMAKERPELDPYGGRDLTVIAWLWARTVKSPNPAFSDVDVPLVSNFMLSTRKGSEAYIEPLIEGRKFRFAVRVGRPRNIDTVRLGTRTSRGAHFRCLLSGAPIPANHVRAEAQAGRMGARLMAIVAEGDRERVFLDPSPQHEATAKGAKPRWKPDLMVTTPCHDVDRLPMYGMPTWGDAFTDRQLEALTTLADLVTDAMGVAQRDAVAAGVGKGPEPLRDGGAGSRAYAEAIGVYLAMAVDRVADRHSSIATWDSSPSKLQLRNTFARQAIPMTWDYGEGNVFCQSSGTWSPSVEWVARAITALPTDSQGAAFQCDASTQEFSRDGLVSTDPPYYDNIGYADLSDFFYVWLRRSLRGVFPGLFATVAVPKVEELVASPSRHGGKREAEAFFLKGMTHAMRRLAEQAHPAFPVTIYYAFKQAETRLATGTSSTGWETFLDSVIRSGFGVTGTWPMRTELSNRMIGSGTNALASSIILVCRPRPVDAPSATRREFVAALKAELPQALACLQRGNIAPVDLAQAAIGPGMAVFTRYADVLDAEGKALAVRDALALINQTLDEALAEQEGDFDADTRWALTWFEQSGFDDGEYGVAEQLSKSKNTSVAGMVDAGILESKRGKVRLLRPVELPIDWNPVTDPRLTAWEVVHHLIRALADSGEEAAAALVARLGAKAELARDLAYRLYVLSERKKRAAEALAYNGLVQSFPELVRLAQQSGKPKVSQGDLFGEGGD